MINGREDKEKKGVGRQVEGWQELLELGLEEDPSDDTLGELVEDEYHIMKKQY